MCFSSSEPIAPGIAPARCALIACEMIGDELRLVMDELGCAMPVTWLDRGLHETPALLHARLTEAIAALDGKYETILLAMALCGKAVVGVGAAHAQLVIPRCHDCIHLLLPHEPDVHSLYLTRGWLSGERSLEAGFVRACQAHGEKKAMRVYRTMLRNYAAVAMIDTGAYDLASACAAIRPLAERFDLRLDRCAGTARMLRALLTGQWDGSFCCVPPGEALRLQDFLDEPMEPAEIFIQERINS